MKTLTLHAHPHGPNPVKVAIVLEILKIPYEVKLWDFGNADNGVKGSIFTKINENGRVPALGMPSLLIMSGLSHRPRGSQHRGGFVGVWGCDKLHTSHL